ILVILESCLQQMRRSKLEIHIAILRALACNGRLKPTHITYKANVNCSALKECLDFLMERNLIKEQLINRRRKTRKVYAITDTGLAALRNVNEINKALHVFEEPNMPGIELLNPR
ncbi:MAG: winged helix-turn-helix domain-containing protein, partial [Candidatus Bathyarchaeota archaeon]